MALEDRTLAGRSGMPRRLSPPGHLSRHVGIAAEQAEPGPALMRPAIHGLVALR